MRNFTSSVVRLTVGLLAATVLFTARAEQGKFYVKADVGAAVTTDTELKEFFGQALAPNSEISFNPGFHLGVRGGYGVTDWFDAEVETGFSVNHIDSITGASEADGDVTNIPLLANARFHYPAFHGISPYLGAGLGFSSTVLSADDIVIGGTTMDGSTSGLVFAYQAFAGVRFALNEQMGISLEYHYFQATSAELDAAVVVGTTSDELKLGGISTHLVTLAFDYRF